MSQKVAIIGFGNAGIQALTALRQEDPDAQVVVFAGEKSNSAANPMLTTYYSGNRIDHQEMFPYGPAESICKELNACLRTETVTGLDPKDKGVILASGEKACFDKILVATGSAPFVPVAGKVDSGKLFTMRTPTDAEFFKTHLKPVPKTALVAGSSMVGIKVCEVLNNLGTKVILADMTEKIFPLNALPCVADAVMENLEKRGVELRFGQAISTVSNIDGGVRATFADGSQVDVDIAAMCIGIRPRTTFLGKALEMDKGILVNEYMETSVPGIYAAGDCVQMRGDAASIGLWLNAAYQGRTAGLNMAGKVARYTGNVHNNITHFMNMDFIGIGNPNQEGEVIDFGIQSCPTMYRALVKDGEIKCVNILGDVRGGGPLRNILTAYLRGDDVKLTPQIVGMLATQGVSDEFIRLLERSEKS